MKKINKKCSSKKSISSSREEISKYPIENSEFETNLPNMDHQNLSTENLKNSPNPPKTTNKQTKRFAHPARGQYYQQNLPWTANRSKSA